MAHGASVLLHCASIEQGRWPILQGLLFNKAMQVVHGSAMGSGPARGLVSLGIFINPILEGIPKIRKRGTVGKMPLLPYSAMATQGQHKAVGVNGA